MGQARTKERFDIVWLEELNAQEHLYRYRFDISKYLHHVPTDTIIQFSEIENNRNQQYHNANKCPLIKARPDTLEEIGQTRSIILLRDYPCSHYLKLSCACRYGMLDYLEEACVSLRDIQACCYFSTRYDNAESLQCMLQKSQKHGDDCHFYMVAGSIYANTDYYKTKCSSSNGTFLRFALLSPHTLPSDAHGYMEYPKATLRPLDFRVKFSNEFSTGIVWACKFGHYDQIFISHDANDREKQLQAFQVAAQFGQVQVLQYLLDKQVPVTIDNILEACYNALRYHQLPILNWLSQYYREYLQWNGECVLNVFMNGSRGMVQYMTRHYREWKSHVQYIVKGVCESGNVHLIDFLVDEFKHLSLIKQKMPMVHIIQVAYTMEETLLRYACFHGHLPIIKYLFDSKHLDSSHHFTAFKYACDIEEHGYITEDSMNKEFPHEHVIKHMLFEQKMNTMRLFYMDYGNRTIHDTLIQYKALDLNKALYCATRNGLKHLISYLIGHGASNINECLYFARLNNDNDIADLLKKHGAQDTLQGYGDAIRSGRVHKDDSNMFPHYLLGL
jgi:hypothetical protein